MRSRFFKGIDFFDSSFEKKIDNAAIDTLNNTCMNTLYRICTFTSNEKTATLPIYNECLSEGQALDRNYVPTSKMR
jgi:hypothetical protein